MEFCRRGGLCHRTYSRVGRHVAGQLLRCGTSSAPNYDEACDAESRKDFAHKLSISTKEMRESSGWLKFLRKLALRKLVLVPTEQLDPLIKESLALRRMLGRSLLTVRRRPDLSKDSTENPNSSDQSETPSDQSEPPNDQTSANQTSNGQ